MPSLKYFLYLEPIGQESFNIRMFVLVKKAYALIRRGLVIYFAF